MSDLPKPGRSGAIDMEAIGQKRDEVAEHVARAREAVKQQQLRGVGGARLAIEDLEAVHVGGSIVDGGHGVFLSKTLRPALRPLKGEGRVQREATSATASRMMSTTAEGAVTIGA